MRRRLGGLTSARSRRVRPYRRSRRGDCAGRDPRVRGLGRIVRNEPGIEVHSHRARSRRRSHRGSEVENGPDCRDGSGTPRSERLDTGQRGRQARLRLRRDVHGRRPGTRGNEPEEDRQEAEAEPGRRRGVRGPRRQRRARHRLRHLERRLGRDRSRLVPRRLRRHLHAASRKRGRRASRRSTASSRSSRTALEQPLTTVSPDVHRRERRMAVAGRLAKAGEGVIVGVLDTGIWPEHPSFADPGIAHPGRLRTRVSSAALIRCSARRSPVTTSSSARTPRRRRTWPSTTRFRAKTATTRRISARHAMPKVTGRTPRRPRPAALSRNTTLLGVPRGAVSGMAPGAHVIMYRVCMRLGLLRLDSVSAVDQAILDGVDVLNFSISGASARTPIPWSSPSSRRTRRGSS